jgi:hypothetical protein
VPVERRQAVDGGRRLADRQGVLDRGTLQKRAVDVEQEQEGFQGPSKNGRSG